MQYANKLVKPFPTLEDKHSVYGYISINCIIIIVYLGEVPMTSQPFKRFRCRNIKNY